MTDAKQQAPDELVERVARKICGNDYPSELERFRARAVLAEIAKAGCDGEPYARSVWAHDRKDPIALAVWNRDIAWETWLAAQPGRAANVAAVDAAEKRVSELETELEARKASHSDSIDALQKELTQARARIAELEAGRVGPLALLRDPVLDDNKRLTKELAEAREELRLQEPIIRLARLAKNQGTPKLREPFMALDAHRAKLSPQSPSGAVPQRATSAATDDEPPRVGDVVRVDWCESSRFRAGQEVKVHCCEARWKNETREGDFYLCDNPSKDRALCRVTIIRRAGQPEAEAVEPRHGMFARSKFATPITEPPQGGPGPHTETVVDLVRRVKQLEAEVFSGRIGQR